ncbi:MAG: radical SAM protein [Bacteroidaceae bacterium]|nr:radical SAM protein [Bacteroidaceae bacterium]
MATVIYPSPIFGPVHSRRLGISLGINLMPADGKVCTFDCIYCECGYNADRRPRDKRPTRQQVQTALETKLKKMNTEGLLPDVLTFAGNGEPTAHPDFLNIIRDTIVLRDHYCPGAKISVLSNATLITRPKVFEALLLVDNNILKLDTVDLEYIHRVNRPTGDYDVRVLIEKMKEFAGHVIIQTMFMHGTIGTQDAGNVKEEYIAPWLEAVREIGPQQVMVYTIDRETPDHDLRKATHEELDNIVRRIEALGVKATASY